MVFLHGWTMDRTIFANQFHRLAGEFHCFAPDLPGHGENRSDGSLSVGGAAAELGILLEAEDLRDVILVGWSLGALVAWHYLAAHGGRARGMISVDMSPKPLNEADWTLGLCGLDREACLATTERFRKHWRTSIPAIAAGMFAERDGPADLEFDQAVGRIASNDPLAMVAMWESLLATDLRAAIAHLPVPLLATYGRASHVYEARTAKWLVGNTPRGSCREFAASGHSPHLEEPELFADVVRDFSGSV